MEMVFDRKVKFHVRRNRWCRGQSEVKSQEWTMFRLCSVCAADLSSKRKQMCVMWNAAVRIRGIIVETMPWGLAIKFDNRKHGA